MQINMLLASVPIGTRDSGPATSGVGEREARSAARGASFRPGWSLAPAASRSALASDGKLMPKLPKVIDVCLIFGNFDNPSSWPHHSRLMGLFRAAHPRIDELPNQLLPRFLITHFEIIGAAWKYHFQLVDIFK